MRYLNSYKNYNFASKICENRPKVMVKFYSQNTKLFSFNQETVTYLSMHIQQKLMSPFLRKWWLTWSYICIRASCLMMTNQTHYLLFLVFECNQMIWIFFFLSFFLFLLLPFCNTVRTSCDRIQEVVPGRHSTFFFFFQVGVCGPYFRSLGLVSFSLSLKRHLVNWKFPNLGVWEPKFGQKLRL